MKRQALLSSLIVLVSSAPVGAQSVFDGTWRPEYPQKFSAARKPDSYDLQNGVYECRSCSPPYSLQADGHDNALRNDPDFDTLNIKVIDAHTVLRVARKGGQLAFESKLSVGEDGMTLTDLQTIMVGAAHPYVVRIRSRRVGPAAPGSHAISGQWQRLDYDLPNNDEDTTFHVEGNTLTMSDKFGRSFSARLDGTDAAYRGAPQFSSVSLQLLDSHTLEERDKKDGKVVKITRWAVDPDGKTIHARFDDTHGRIQQQDGHKLP